MLAHSLRFVLPRITAPAFRSLAATVESFGGLAPTSASEPAVVIILSLVSMLSLIRIGIPCSGPRTLPPCRSLSIASAIASASGFNSITALTAGPCLSRASIRARYFSASACAEYFPDFIPSCRSEIETSSSSNAGTGETGGAAEAISRAPASAGSNATVAPPIRLFFMKRLRPGTVPALLDWLKWILLCCWVVGMVRPRWNLSQRRRQDSLRLFCLARTRKRMPGSFALFANQGETTQKFNPSTRSPLSATTARPV